MLPRYRGPAGEYMWEKERRLQQDQLDRYRERPWEFQTRGVNIRGLIITSSLSAAVLVGLLYLLSLLAR